KSFIQEVIKRELNAFGKTAGYIKWKSECVLNEGFDRAKRKDSKNAEGRKKLLDGIAECDAKIDNGSSTSTLILNFFCQVFQEKILHQNLNQLELKRYIRFLNWLNTNEKLLPTSIDDRDKAVDQCLLMYLSTLIYRDNRKPMYPKRAILIEQFENNKDYTKLLDMWLPFI
ncbi:MAG: hypothetical protein ACRDDF_07890, partial [Aeromonas sp.]